MGQGELSKVIQEHIDVLRNMDPRYVNEMGSLRDNPLKTHRIFEFSGKGRMGRRRGFLLKILILRRKYRSRRGRRGRVK